LRAAPPEESAVSDESWHLCDALERLASETRGPGSAHPGAGELLAWHAGELEAAAAEAVLDHLAVCVECARLALEIPAFLASAALPRVAAAGPREIPKMPSARPRSPARMSLLALAAALALCAIGWSLRLPGHFRPQPEASFVRVYPPEQRRGGEPAAGSRPVRLRLESQATGLIVELPAPPLAAPSDPRWRVEIVGTGGQVLSAPAAVAVNQQEVVVLFTLRQLPPGDYRLRVLADGSGRARLIQEYPLRVLSP
jgi:hypothetical protein